MTTLLVAQLKVDSSDSSASLDDLLELLSLQTTDTKFDEAWVTVCCSRLTMRTRQRICESLHIPGQRLLWIAKPLDAEVGSRLLASAIAFLGRHKRVALYDGNADLAFGNLIPNSANFNLAANGIFGYLHQLDDFHRLDRLTDILTCLDRLLSGLRDTRSSPSRTLEQLIRPMARFIRTLDGLLLRPPPSDGTPNLGRYESLTQVDFSVDVARLNEIYGTLHRRLAVLDFVESSTNFFRYGARALGALRTAPRSRFRDVFPKVLAWWHAYHLAASKELSNLGYSSSALLHVTRAFETYVLAYLWRLDLVKVKGALQRFYLSDGTEPGLDTLQRALWRVVPLVGKELLYMGLEDLRLSRNSNLLVHGFHLPSEGSVRRARLSVKGIVSHAEEQLPSGVEILRGAIGAFWHGERRCGDMGKAVATILLRPDELGSVSP